MRWLTSFLGCLALCAAMLHAGTAMAGAWVPAPGGGYAKLWTKWLHGFGYHDGAGNTLDYGSYEELFLATYGELGVVPGVAVTWHVDLLRSAFLQDGLDGDVEGHATFGDPRVGVRLELLRAGRWALAAELTGLAPLANDGALQPFIYDGGEGELRLGAGVWEAGASLSAGVGYDCWSGGNCYAQLGGGYLLRSDGFDDVLQFQLETGASLFTDVAARLRVTGHLPIEEADAPYVDNPAGVGNGVSYVGFALEADYELAKGWFLGLTVEGGIVAIERQTGGPVLSLYAAHAF